MGIIISVYHFDCVISSIVSVTLLLIMAMVTILMTSTTIRSRILRLNPWIPNLETHLHKTDDQSEIRHTIFQLPVERLKHQRGRMDRDGYIAPHIHLPMPLLERDNFLTVLLWRSIYQTAYRASLLECTIVSMFSADTTSLAC